MSSFPNIFQLILGSPEAFPIPCSTFWVCPKAFCQLDVPGEPTTGGAQQASWSDARTTSAGPFCRKGGAALLQAAPLQAPSGCPSSSPYLYLSGNTYTNKTLTNILLPFTSILYGHSFASHRVQLCWTLTCEYRPLLACIRSCVIGTVPAALLTLRQSACKIKITFNTKFN